MLSNSLQIVKQILSLGQWKEPLDSKMEVEACLERAFEAMQAEARTYEKAGLTQISNWLD